MGSFWSIDHPAKYSGSSPCRTWRRKPYSLGRRRNAARIAPLPRFTDTMSDLAGSVPRIFGHIYHGSELHPKPAKVLPLTGNKCGLYRGSSFKEYWPSQTDDHCQSGGDPQTSAENALLRRYRTSRRPACENILLSALG